MTADLISQVVLGLPNLAALMLMLYWQQRRIDKILHQQHEVDSRLLALLEECIGGLAVNIPPGRVTRPTDGKNTPPGC